MNGDGHDVSGDDPRLDTDTRNETFILDKVLET